MTTLNQNAPAATAPKSGDFKGGHYYGIDNYGDWFPLYEPEKNFTLREARKIVDGGGVAVPSVTTYFNVLNKPQLNDWAQENAANAMFDFLCDHDASEDQRSDYVEWAISKASEASRPAADLGTRIHKAIELCLADKDYDAELAPYVNNVLIERSRLGIANSVQEEIVGSLKYGYAGRADDLSDGMTALDYKSRKSKGKKVASYETDPVQIAAYGFAKWGNDFFKRGRGIVLAISTTAPGLVTPHEWTGPELVPAFEAFLALTAVWRFMNNFDPRGTA